MRLTTTSRADAMKITHLTWLLSARGGGIPPVIAGLSSGQRAAGANVSVVGIHDPATPPIGGLGNPALVKAVGPLALGWTPRLHAAVSAESADLVHLHGLFTWPSQVASAWTRRTGRPTVISPHGMLEPWALRNSAWKKRLFRLFIEDHNLRRASCLHALCAPEAADMRRLGLERPIAVIPNGVDLPRSTLQPEVGPTNRRVLLFMGRVHPKKGLPHLVEALARVNVVAPALLRDWRLVVAGPDQLGHTAEVRNLASQRGLDAVVEFLGPIHGADKERALATASAFILPSFSEGFSMAVLEAMAYGLPVVVTRQCNLDVSSFGGGLVGEPSAESMADCLIRLFGLGDAERSAMGRRARAEVEARYTWPAIAGQFLSLYGWLSGGGAPPTNVEVL